MVCIKCGQPFQGENEECVCSRCLEKGFMSQKQRIENAQGKCIWCRSSENLSEERMVMIGGEVDICKPCNQKFKDIFEDEDEDEDEDENI